MESSITIITTEAHEPDQFEGMRLEERRERSAGWKRLPLRSGRYLDTFLMKATGSDFGVFASEEHPSGNDGEPVETSVIMSSSIPDVVRALVTMVEQKPDETAAALVKHGGNIANSDRVLEGLKAGTWPNSGDPAEESAAFAFYLLKYARIAEQSLKGLCFEYRGVRP